MREPVLSEPASLIREVIPRDYDPAKVIALWFGEPNEPTPEFIREAAIDALREGDTFYTPNRGIPRLRRILADYMNTLYGQSLDEDWITVTVSSMNAVNVAMQCLIGHGDKLVTLAPQWPNLAAVSRLLGGQTVEVPLTPDPQGWRLDLDRLFDACGTDARAILLNSPGNPTGWMASQEDLAAILDFARRHGTWIVADEVYGRIVFNGRTAPSLVPLITADDRVMVLNSFSKSWAMTGWRLGWITAGPSTGPVLEKMMEFSIAGAPGFVQQAGCEAVLHGEEFITRSVARYRKNRDRFRQWSQDIPGLRAPLPEAAFYYFFSLAGNTDSVALVRRLINEAGVGFAPGLAFGSNWEGWMRACLAVDEDNLEQALERVRPILLDLNNSG